MAGNRKADGFVNGAVTSPFTKLSASLSWLFHDFDKYNSCDTEKCPLAVNGSHRQEPPLGGIPAAGFWERPVTKEPAALWIAV